MGQTRNVLVAFVVDHRRESRNQICLRESHADWWKIDNWRASENSLPVERTRLSRSFGWDGKFTTPLNATTNTLVLRSATERGREIHLFGVTFTCCMIGFPPQKRVLIVAFLPATADPFVTRHRQVNAINETSPCQCINQSALCDIYTGLRLVAEVVTLNFFSSHPMQSPQIKRDQIKTWLLRSLSVMRQV